MSPSHHIDSGPNQIRFFLAAEMVDVAQELAQVIKVGAAAACCSRCSGSLLERCCGRSAASRQLEWTALESKWSNLPWESDSERNMMENYSR